MAIFRWHTVQTNVHAAVQRCVLKVAYPRGSQTSTSNDSEFDAPIERIAGVIATVADHRLS